MEKKKPKLRLRTKFPNRGRQHTYPEKALTTKPRSCFSVGVSEKGTESTCPDSFLLS
jgi:hypothetical protein